MPKRSSCARRNTEPEPNIKGSFALICAGAGGGGSLGGGAVTSLLVEQAVPFTRELAVLLARSPGGRVAVWPVVETVQADGVCYSDRKSVV